jgi:hypothetical protein
MAPVFSSKFRYRVSEWGGLAVIALASLPGPLIVKSAEQMQWDGPALIFACGIGAALNVGLFFLFRSFWDTPHYAILERRLRKRFITNGIDVAGLSGIFVSLAPAVEPRNYEDWTEWDIGFLFLPDQLCYVGERTRFGLYRSQVKAVAVVPGVPQWMSVPMIRISWSDAACGAEGDFLICPGSTQSRFNQIKRVRELAQRLQTWLSAPTRASSPTVLALLPPPRLDSAVGKAIGAKWYEIPVCLAGAAFLAAVAGGVLGLSFNLTTGGSGWCAVMIALFVLCFVMLPYWCYRPPAPTNHQSN